MSKSYQIDGVLLYKLRHMKLINVLKHYGRHKDGLISGKVLILSILESRDLVMTGVLAAAVGYRMEGEDRSRSGLLPCSRSWCSSFD